MTIRVVIVDDQYLVCEGLRGILGTSSTIEVVGEAYTGGQALEVIEKTMPDVVLMDLKMPGMNGIHATRAVRERWPAVRVLVLTTFDSDEWVFDAIRAGAAGYLLKDTPRAEMLTAIEKTAAGKTVVDSDVAGKLFTHIRQTVPLPADELLAELNARETDILKLLARGLTNADIAARLFLSEGTVRNNVSSILSKLNVADRTQAALLALRHGLTADDKL
jgi:two-component system, NarL family, response regulator LiaR